MTESLTRLEGAPQEQLLRIATAAYLARFKGQSRYHADSDLRAFFRWCTEHRLHPMDAKRPHIELYVRWMQEVAGYKAGTVGRRRVALAPSGPGLHRTGARKAGRK